MNVRCYCPINSWNPVAIGPDLVNGETLTLMLHSFVIVSNQHLCNVMIFGDDYRMLDGVRKRGVVQSSSHPEHTIFVEECIERV